MTTDLTPEQRLLERRVVELREDFEEVTVETTMVQGDPVFRIRARQRRTLSVHVWLGINAVTYVPRSDELCTECHRPFSHSVHEKITTVEYEELDFTTDPNPQRRSWTSEQVQDYLIYRRRMGSDPLEGQPADKRVDEDWDRRDTVMLPGADVYSPQLRQPAPDRTAALARQWWDAEVAVFHSRLVLQRDYAVYSYGLRLVVRTEHDVIEWRNHAQHMERLIKTHRLAEPSATQYTDADYWIRHTDEAEEWRTTRSAELSRRWGTPDHPR